MAPPSAALACTWSDSERRPVRCLGPALLRAIMTEEPVKKKKKKKKITSARRVAITGGSVPLWRGCVVGAAYSGWATQALRVLDVDLLRTGVITRRLGHSGGLWRRRSSLPSCLLITARLGGPQ